VISVNDILRSATLVLCLDCDRNTMLIRTADIKNILASHTKISHIDVCRNIHSSKVTDMHRTVRIR
jgi:hypothetical protein